MKNNKINVKGIEITVVRQNDMDYISLTDMLNAKDGDFNYGEFATIKSQTCLNNYRSGYTKYGAIWNNSKTMARSKPKDKREYS